jgi:type I restriction-modification system DNA methylase subunit
MAVLSNFLFSSKTVRRLCRDIEITDKQKESAKEWLDLLDKNQLEDEKKNYTKFEEIILQDILGYTIKKLIFETDNVEFQVANSSGKNIVCFEVKGTSTKDLFAHQNRTKKEHETPFKQTWYYMWKNNLEYGICTNYDSFILITRAGYPKYYKFDFQSIRNDEEKLKEFIGIFSRDRIIESGFVEKTINESMLEEKEITKKLYKLFHQTRLMLIKEFQENPEVALDEAIHYSQLFLNRLVFTFFAKDNGLIIDKRIFTKKIHQALETPLITEHSRLIYDQVLNLFHALDKGSNMMGIDGGFNGGLFQQQIPAKIYFSDIKDPNFFGAIQKSFGTSGKITYDPITTKILKKYPTINSIIGNLLRMDSYDFKSDVNVNILGHIFEQSITDLEELRGIETAKRKKEGVYYTPEYITDYVCRNTIIPYLSNNGVTTVHDLMLEYSNRISDLEEKIKNIKILDPACGSGAFLIKAVEILLEIFREIQDSKPQLLGSSQLESWSEENEITKIIERSIHGVDINEESVEITKLSLFIKLASPNKKLINLSNNIKVGNSLVDDKQVDPKAFDWKNEFKDVFDKGGFDVIIGNPPYFNVETLGVKSPYTEYLKRKYPETWMDKSDILFYFITKAIQLTKKNIGFITSNAFLFSEKAEKLRNFILENAPISKIVNFEKYLVFEDASITCTIIDLDKSKKDYRCNAVVLKKDKYTEQEIIKIITDKTQYFDVNLKKNSVFALVNEYTDAINSKMDKKGINLGSLFEVGSGMQTGANDVFIFNSPTTNFPSEVIRKRISGENIDRYLIKKEKENCLYVEDFKKFEDLPKDVQSYLLDHKAELENRADKKRRKTARWWDYTFSMHKEQYHLDKIWCSYRSKNNTFAFDNTREHIGFTNTTVIFGTNKDISLKYLLALLNSSAVDYRYKTIGKQTGGGIFEYFENGISKIPIVTLDAQKQTPFIEKVDQIMTYKKQVYDLTQKFSNRIIQNFDLKKLSTELNEFDKIDFKQFMEILKKNYVTLTLEKQDEWETYFETKKNEIIKIKDKIKKIDMDIDDLVYDLYGITKDERKIIENVIRHASSENES